MGWFIVFIISLLTWPIDGWFIHLLWGWYVVPLGVPALSIMHGAGISALFSLISFRHRKSPDDALEGFKQMCNVMLGKALFVFITFCFYFFFGI